MITTGPILEALFTHREYQFNNTAKALKINMDKKNYMGNKRTQQTQTASTSNMSQTHSAVLEVKELHKTHNR